jgi:hypothetical protein
VETRLRKLERWNKVLLAGLALALLPWLVAAAKEIPDLLEGKNGKFQTVAAAGFSMQDDQGNKYGGLTAKKDGSSLIITDGNGKTRLFLGILKGNPSLLFADKDGRTVASYAEKNGSFESEE